MKQSKTAKTFPQELAKEAIAAPSPASHSATTEADFRAALSQKLRTPLNAIVGFAELMSMRPTLSAREADVQHILNAARDLLEIINRELVNPNVPGRKCEPSVVPPIACDVLYIEDDLVNFTLVERILEFRPALKLLHAARGQTGIELAQIHHPRLILLDLNLPDMHGSEIIQQLQRDPATIEIPVVVLSADATPSQIERLLTAGARNYLTKPFDIDPFLAVVDDFVSTATPTMVRC
jgi:CheY-like chemotaxis protein